MTVRDFSVLACLSHPRIKLLSQTVHHCYMSRLMTKPTKWHVRPAKTQISLGIRPVWSESSLSAWGKLGSLDSIPNSKFINFSDYTITYNYMRCNTISNILVATHWTHSEDLLRFLEYLLYSFFFSFFFFVVKNTVQEFEQHQCHDIIRSSEMNMLFSK